MFNLVGFCNDFWFGIVGDEFVKENVFLRAVENTVYHVFFVFVKHELSFGDILVDLKCLLFG